MASATSAQAARAFLLLSDATVERCEDLQGFASESDVIDTDEEVESESQFMINFAKMGEPALSKL